MSGQVSCLLAVDKGDPDKISKRQHEAKAVIDDVDCCENCGLHEYAIDNVNCLHNCNKDDAVAYETKGAVLFGDESTVEEDPTKHARAQFHPLLDIDLTDNRKCDTRVELSSHVEIVYEIARASTFSK